MRELAINVRKENKADLTRATAASGCGMSKYFSTSSLEIFTSSRIFREDSMLLSPCLLLRGTRRTAKGSPTVIFRLGVGMTEPLSFEDSDVTGVEGS